MFDTILIHIKQMGADNSTFMFLSHPEIAIHLPLSANNGPVGSTYNLVI